MQNTNVVATVKTNPRYDEAMSKVSAKDFKEICKRANKIGIGEGLFQKNVYYFLEELKRYALEKGKIEVVDFCSIEIKERAERFDNLHNNQKTPAFKFASFKPAKEFKTTVRKSKRYVADRKKIAVEIER